MFGRLDTHHRGKLSLLLNLKYAQKMSVRNIKILSGSFENMCWILGSHETASLLTVLVNAKTLVSVRHRVRWRRGEAP